MEIDNLELQIHDNADIASQGLLGLAAAMEQVQAAARGGIGLTAVSNQLKKLSDTVAGAADPSAKITNIAAALRDLQSVGKVNLGTGLKSITSLPATFAALNSVDLNAFREGLTGLAGALKPLESLGKTNLSSTLNALGKLPKISEQLKAMDFGQLEQQVRRVTAALKPLADEMQKISTGFSLMPAKLKAFASQSGTVAASNKKLSQSFGLLGQGILSSGIMRLGLVYVAVSRIARAMNDWVRKSIDYIENVNLFTVSMGKFADEAMAYAERVQSLAGIDVSEWIRNQGMFMQIATGFGVVEDKAYTMSKALTQVSYDISSLMNIDIGTAIQKVQSGLAGELEPLRRIGYALDQATLQQVAYNHGITQSIRTMNQAQKSQLRFIAIMEQSGNAMQDLARNIDTPANALRILGQQVTQLARALGDALLPFLAAVIPYLQAFVKLTTLAVKAWAGLDKSKLPSEDDLPDMTPAVDGLEDMEDAANAAGKAIKNATTGLDELNIISESAGAGSLGGGDLGIDLEGFDYDFLAGLSEKVSEAEAQIRYLLELVASMFQPVTDRIVQLFSVIGEQMAALDWGETFANLGVSALNAIRAVFQTVITLVAPIIEGLNIPAIVLAALDLLANIFNTIAAALDAVTPGLKAFVETGLRPIAQWLGGKILDGLEFLSERFVKLGDWFTKHKDDFTAFGKKLGDATAVVWKFLEPIADVAWETAKNTIVELSDALFALGGWLVEHGPDVEFNLSNISGAFAGYKAALGIANLLKNVENGILGVSTASAIAAVKQYALNFAMRLNPFKLITDLLGALVAKFTELWNTSEGFRNFWSGVWDTVLNTVRFAVESISGLFGIVMPDIIDNFVGWFKSIPDKLKELGGDIVAGLFKGITDAFEGAGGFFTNIADNVVAGFEKVFKINSPSKLMMPIGEFISAGLGVGVEDGISPILATAAGVASSLVSTLQHALGVASGVSGDAKAAGLALMQSLAGGITEGAQGAIDALNKAASKVLTSLVSVFGVSANQSAQAKQVGASIMTSISAGITETLQGTVLTLQLAMALLLATINQAFSIAGAHSLVFATVGRILLTSLASGVKVELPNVVKVLQDACNALLTAMNVVFEIVGGVSAKTRAVGRIIMESIGVGVTDGVKATESAVQSALQALLAMIQSFVSKIKSALAEIKSAAASASASVGGASASLSGPAMAINGYAAGGIVRSGEIFAARENGLPEVVGRFGRHTAVANNDQITAGFKQAFLEAIFESGMLQRGQEDRPFELRVDISGKQVHAEVEKVSRGRGATIFPGGADFEL